MSDAQVEITAVCDATGCEGPGRAACGQLIPAAGLTIKSAPAGFCAGCVAVGTAR